VNKADDTQKQWFTALLNTQVLKCKESIKCVDRWAHLCTIGDVSRLLSMSTLIKDPRAMKLVIKCASTLDTEDLILATVRHFYQDGIYNNLNEDIQLQLVLLFNKIKDKNNTTEFCKDLYLLLLQNFEKTLSYIFAECLKNTFYTYNLESIWPHLAKIITIDEIGLKVLKREIDINVPNEDNCKNYSELFNELTKNHVYCVESMILNVLLPMLQKAYEEQNYELLKHGLQILMYIVLQDMKENIDLKESTDCLFHFLFDLMKNCRCDFTNFDGLKQELVKRSADFVLKYCRLSSTFSCSDRTVNTEDIFVLFYVKQLSEGGKKSNALTHFFPVNFENHAETVAYMIKILPLCVTPEWVIISSALQYSCGTEKTMELLCDVIILLCELIKSQDTKTDEVARMLNALKYCLQNLGVTIKETLQPNVHSLQEDVCITRHMCRLLREIPAGKIKSEEGLSLASVLTEASLMSLRTDKKFVCLVSSINESRICKMLAQKILS
jgi:hypothetical protein